MEAGVCSPSQAGCAPQLLSYASITNQDIRRLTKGGSAFVRQESEIYLWAKKNGFSVPIGGCRHIVVIGKPIGDVCQRFRYSSNVYQGVVVTTLSRLAVSRIERLQAWRLINAAGGKLYATNCGASPLTEADM